MKLGDRLRACQSGGRSCGGRRKRSHGQQRQRASARVRKKTDGAAGLCATQLRACQSGGRSCGGRRKRSHGQQRQRASARLLLLHARSISLSLPPSRDALVGRVTFFEASIPDLSIDAHAAAPRAHSCCCLRVHGVVRPLGNTLPKGRLHVHESGSNKPVFQGVDIRGTFDFSIPYLNQIHADEVSLTVM